MAGFFWLWWNGRKTEAQWWHKVEERYNKYKQFNLKIQF